MSEEPVELVIDQNIKVKYVTKKCEHNKRKDTCKKCKGASICIHSTLKNICRICKGSSICPHDKRKQICKLCNPKAFCIHERLKICCKVCNSKILCKHNKIENSCKLCNPKIVCEHSRIKLKCKSCNPKAFCIHERLKICCKVCNSKILCEHLRIKLKCESCNPKIQCEHGKRKNRCKICKGSEICPHNHIKYTCKICKGSAVCPHNLIKNACLDCTPNIACLCCKSVNGSRSKWKPYCFRCYCILNPDAIIPRKYKLKEHYVVDALKEHIQDITMIFDKRMGCSKRRPDVCIDFGSHCLMIEIDENRHVNYSCEEKRMVDLYEDIGFRKIVFLRFNPDGYKEIKKYPSPFQYTKTGILKLDNTEFNRRIIQLIDKINHHKEEPIEQLTVEYLFYGE
jgi:hypothetical protein